MGKIGFKEIYAGAAESFDSSRPLIRLSCASVNYHEDGNFVGMIIYSHRGDYSWVNEVGVKKGGRSRGFYVLIEDTDKMLSDCQRSEFYFASSSHHSYLHKRMFAKLPLAETCCGGFGIRGRKITYNSGLNSAGGHSHGLSWESDGSRDMSACEKLIVKHLVAVWMKCSAEETGFTISIPDDMHRALLIMLCPEY
jgi:hypothetical protein